MAADAGNRALRDDELSIDEWERASGGSVDANGSHCYCSNTSCPPTQDQQHLSLAALHGHHPAVVHTGWCPAPALSRRTGTPVGRTDYGGTPI